FHESEYDSYRMRFITLKYPVSIRDLAVCSEVPESVIYFFNPQLTRQSTPLIVKNYSILIPAENADILRQNEEKLYKLRFNCIKTHTVRKGEYLGKIARQYNVPMKYIIAINTLRKPYTLYPGSTLYIPIL
ncbi:MAG: LysM peptidoglycan-binding domain-containing protein, partial [Spirochaetota bacterium]